MKLGLGLGLTSPKRGAGGGGGGGYVAKAVHFGGAAALYRLSALVGLSDVPEGIANVWFRATDAPSQLAFLGFFEGLTGGGLPLAGADYSFFGINTPDATDQPYCFLATDGYTSEIDWASDGIDVNDNTWRNMLASWKTDEDSGSRLATIYISDAKNSTVIGDDGPSFSPFISTPQVVVGNGGWEFGTEDPTSALVGDLADLSFFAGVGIVETDGTISEVNRRLFIDADGKPVDPATAIAELGDPVVLFSGDHTDFATNQGTGGAFTLTGTLTDATTSPSD